MPTNINESGYAPIIAAFIFGSENGTQIPIPQTDENILVKAIDENGICRAAVDVNQLKGIISNLKQIGKQT